MNAPQPTVDLVQVDDLLDTVISFDWFDSTNEKSNSNGVLIGLMDPGSFAEKVPPCFSTLGLAAKP